MLIGTCRKCGFNRMKNMGAKWVTDCPHTGNHKVAITDSANKVICPFCMDSHKWEYLDIHQNPHENFAKCPVYSEVLVVDDKLVD